MKKIILIICAVIAVGFLSTSCTKKSKTCSCTQYSPMGTPYGTDTYDDQTSCANLELQLEAAYDGTFYCHEL